ncbi:MAG: biotin--[acetyl-CoA-carboxylase] ligase [bacterium]
MKWLDDSIKYLHLKKCESTQELIQSIESGWFLIWSDAQGSGHGTRGREWVSPPGGLYYSLAFPTHTTTAADPMIPLGAALVWKRLLSDLFPTEATDLSLKWPNDLLHKGRKLGGFLANKHSGMFYVGVGINVNNPLDETDGDLRRPPVSLLELTGDHQDRTELLLRWSNRFQQAVSTTSREVFDADRIEEHLSTIGKSIRLENGTGQAIGLGENGELKVMVNEEALSVYSGDDVEVLNNEAGR